MEKKRTRRRFFSIYLGLSSIIFLVEYLRELWDIWVKRENWRGGPASGLISYKRNYHSNFINKSLPTESYRINVTKKLLYSSKYNNPKKKPSISFAWHYIVLILLGYRIQKNSIYFTLYTLYFFTHIPPSYGWWWWWWRFSRPDGGCNVFFFWLNYLR